MSFRVQGLDPRQFQHLIGLSDEDLAARGAKRYVVDAKPGFPDRVEVRDLEVGETAILLNYEHLPADTPYRSRHAIFVGETSEQALELVDALPDAVRCRPISLRAFNASGEMLDADLADGAALTPLIERFFDNPDVSYLHAHYAKRGCYAACITRNDTTAARLKNATR
ncbi:hypothetical protein WSK_2616 [Novosphingobium sp. Rr 2-17]|uniref:DUF1203 domain-containing protein n=1 Tax=Novosphingobium sp. Rr 2-17 TaxID=555793 RepID=UPI0002698541|nr:DUF1203 domain-containing protein [Novosphingobium sp. Rr 2-17]EIZ78569.1 hypothetical protein WSK_2616 [Novosphingobium sp. Rr 2-17]